MNRWRGLPFRNVSFSAARLGISVVLPLAVYPLLLRRLGAEEFGHLMLAQSILAYMTILAEFGFQISGIRMVAGTSCRTTQHQLLLEITSARVLMMAPAWLLLVPLCWLSGTSSIQWILGVISLASATATAFQPAWFLQAIEKFDSIFIAQLWAKAICFLAIVFAVKEPGDLVIAHELLCLPAVLSGIALLAQALVWTGGALRLPGLRACLGQLRRNLLIFGGTAAGTLFANSTTLIAASTVGVAQAGIYAIAEKFVRSVVLLTTPFTDAAYPVLVRKVERSKDEAIRYLKVVLVAGGGLFGLASIILAVSSKPIGNFLSPMAGSVVSMCIALMCIVPLTAFLNTITIQLLNIQRSTVSYFTAMVGAGSLTVILCFLGSRWYGIVGVPVSVSIGEVVLLAALSGAAVCSTKRGSIGSA